MGKEIVVNAEKAQTRIAILENGDLVELYIEDPENVRTIGDIYLGRIRKVMPSIRAAFVDIGQKQDAFLHFSDLVEDIEYLLDFVDQENPHVASGSGKSQKPQRKRGKRRKPSGGKGGSGDASGEKERGKSDSKSRSQRRQAQQRSKRGGKARRHTGNPERLLRRDRRILVKVVKEPISNKGSRVSTDISMAGRFLVLVPFGDYVAVSKKINSYKERRRLKALAKSLVPDGFGVIIRTVAEGKNAKTLDTDLKLLLDKWRKLEQKLAGKPDAPMVVHQDVNMLSSVMRDLFTDDYDRVLIDDEKLYRNVRSYTQAVAPQMTDAIRHHRGKQHVFEAAGVYAEIQEAFEGRVNLPSGGYLFIEHTEAMHVVDVNSGRSGRGLSQEENSLRVNLEAARSISRQIRIRDLGGIIVVDFIDLRNENNKRKVYDELKKEFKKDRAVSKILPMSDFGLIQITRQRMRPSITASHQGPDFLTKNGSTDGAKEAKQETKKEPPKEERRTQPRPQLKARSPREAADSRPAAGAATVEERPSAPRTEVPPEVHADPEGLLQDMEQWLVDYKTMGNRRAVTLRVHPFTAAYLNRKVPNHPTRWFMKHLVRVRLEPDGGVSPLTFRFIDTRSGEDLTEKVALPDG